jgi:hypothetical protein
MPPRTLPWLTERKDRPYDPLSTSSPAPPPRRKRDATPSSDQDLVDPDLNPTGVSTPQRRAKQRLLQTDRSPSTSPPPAPPSVEYMREGYGADDAWMMVEDELYSTAQLYTQHLHHAAYAEQKRRAQARGNKVLKTMNRPTDGRTERDGMMVEREERDKSIKKALGVEEEEGILTDPLLGALMNDPQRMGRALEGIGKVKSKSRAANGFLRSPEKPRRTFTEVPNGDSGAVSEDHSETDSDDLDGSATKASQQSTMASQKPVLNPNAAASSVPRRETDIFRKFAAVSNEEPSRPRSKPDPPSHTVEKVTKVERPEQRSDERRVSGASKQNDTATSIDDYEVAPKSKARDEPAYLVKRRQKKEEEEKRKAKEKKASIEVPTFLF